jgi:hypothetical protein
MSARPTSKSPLCEARSLHGEVRRVEEVTASERGSMLGLMRQYFENVTPQAFARDLDEKEWAILLRDSGGEIRGFSTLMRLEAEVDGELITAFFSGDTIIAREFWGETALPRMWARLAFDLATQIRRERPDAKIYWFLIASGYKTYRFLPVFFRDFFPRFDAETPAFESRVLQVLGRQKFGDQFDSKRGIVRFEDAAALREGVAEITDERLQDAHIAFFVRANAGHARGDELACLCEISEANLTAAGRKMLGLERLK